MMTDRTAEKWVAIGIIASTARSDFA